MPINNQKQLIDFKHLKPHQLKILDLFDNHHATYNVLTGGAGTFKTSTAILGWVLHCMNYPGQLIYVVGVDYKTVNDVWVGEFEKQFKGTDLKYKLKGGKGDRELYLLDYDSMFSFRQWSRPTTEDALKSFATGPTISGYHLLQPDMLDDDTKKFFGRFDQRVRMFGGDVDEPKHKRLIDQNAPYPDHWTHDFFFNEQHEQFFGRDPGAMKRIHTITTPETSVYTARGIARMERQMPSHLFQRFVNGEAVASEGLVYKEYHLCEPVKPEDVVHYTVGFDPGEGEHPYAYIFIGHLKDGRRVVFDEIQEKRHDQDYQAKMLEDKCEYWGADKLKFIVYGWDGQVYRSYNRNHLKIKGIAHHFPSAQRDKWFLVRMGIDLLSICFKDKRLYICSNLEKTKRDLMRYSNSDDGYRPDKKKYDPHLLDALRYAWIRETISDWTIMGTDPIINN